MDIALIWSAALMGLAGTPHCVAMCGPACAAMGASGGASPSKRGGWLRGWGFHLGRLVGYAAAGAVAAAGVSVLGAASAAVPVLRPLWSLVHVAALGLGLWLLFTAKQPAWVERLGRAQRPAAQRLRDGTAVVAWRPFAKSFGCGTLWVAWPCGLLQSAIVVAALANGPAAGAAVMAAFTIASGLGLAGGSALWLRAWHRGAGGARRASDAAHATSLSWVIRASGLMLAAASAWALGHGLWMRVIDACFS